MRVRGYDLTYPRLLLVGLVVVIVAAGVVGLSTSSTAFGSYNSKWDGTSDLRTVAISSGATTDLTQSTDAYSSHTPTETTAFILSPTDTYGSSDSAHVSTFLERGGTVVVADDFGGNGNALLAQLGVTARFDGRLVRDEHRYYRSPNFPVATNVSEAPATANVSRLTLNHATVVEPGPNSSVLVTTSGYAYLDTNGNQELDDNEPLQDRPVVVREAYGDGEVVVVSDPSIFINSMLESPDNQLFARNLIADDTTVVFDYSHRSGIPWAVAVVHTIADSPLFQLVVIGLLTGVCVLAWRDRGDGIRQILTGETTDRLEPASGLSQADVLERVTARHPEWDAERVERVAKGIMPGRSNTGDDD